MSERDRTPSSGHPDALLAGHVDGTLTPAEGEEVRSHLAGCERCRAEVRQAESARRALRSLPEVDPPFGLGRRAVDESRRGNRGPVFRRVAAVAGAAAAVALVVGVALALLHGGSGGGASTSSERAAGGARAPGPAPSPAPKGRYLPEDTARFSRSPTDYTDASIRSLAAAVARHAQTGAGVSAPPAAPTSGRPAGTTSGATTGVMTNDQAAGTRAAGCVDRAWGLPPSAVPRSVIEARFQGTPAYIGIFLLAPVTGGPPDRVQVWVAARDGCRPLSYAQTRIH
jgi:Putative zinc-finger